MEVFEQSHLILLGRIGMGQFLISDSREFKKITQKNKVKEQGEGRNLFLLLNPNKWNGIGDGREKVDK